MDKHNKQQQNKRKNGKQAAPAALKATAPVETVSASQETAAPAAKKQKASTRHGK